MKLIVVTLSLFFFAATAFSGELKGVKMKDQRSFEGTEFQLNSMGLRQVKKFGFPVKVYVGGLYLKAKESDSNKIQASEDPKWVVIQFVRNVDRKPLADGWRKALKKACKACDESLAQLKLFNKKMVNVRTKNRLEIGFFKDKVILEVKARETSRTEFASSAFSKDLLSIFIGEENPADKKLRKGLLGLK